MSQINRTSIVDSFPEATDTKKFRPDKTKPEFADRPMFEYINDDLVKRGDAPFPKSPDQTTKDEAMDHIALVCSDRINTELTTDPDGRGYAGMTDQQVVDELVRTYSVLTGYESDDAFVMVVTAVAGDVLTLKNENGEPITLFRTTGRLHFLKSAVASLADLSFDITDRTDVTLTVPGLPVAPGLTDLCYVERELRSIVFPPMKRLFVGVPYAPNILTADDVAKARA